ncbi:hypothetical protein [Thermococcus sp.]
MEYGWSRIAALSVLLLLIAAGAQLVNLPAGSAGHSVGWKSVVACANSTRNFMLNVYSGNGTDELVFSEFFNGSSLRYISEVQLQGINRTLLVNWSGIQLFYCVLYPDGSHFRGTNSVGRTPNNLSLAALLSFIFNPPLPYNMSVVKQGGVFHLRWKAVPNASSLIGPVEIEANVTLRGCRPHEISISVTYETIGGARSEELRYVILYPGDWDYAAERRDFLLRYSRLWAECSAR